jgi:hypothetical protein
MHPSIVLNATSSRDLDIKPPSAELALGLSPRHGTPLIIAISSNPLSKLPG